MACPTWHTLGRCWRKEGNVPSKSFPRSCNLVGIVPIHSNCLFIIFHCVKYLWKILCEFHRFPYLPIAYSAQQDGRYGYLYETRSGMVQRFVSQIWGLVPFGYVNSPPNPCQALGTADRAYHWFVDSSDTCCYSKSHAGSGSTSLGDSHPLVTRLQRTQLWVSKPQDADRQLFFSLL